MTMVDELRHLDGIKGNFYILAHESNIVFYAYFVTHLNTIQCK